MKTRLGVNIDHVATLRNVRRAPFPDVGKAARLVMEAGADSITVHLREDRRHILDRDVYGLVREVPLNLEIAASEEMLAIAREVAPQAVCLVPERRAELTTEGGLDVVALQKRLAAAISSLKGSVERVALFVEAQKKHIDAAAAIGATAIELHCGGYQAAVASSDPARINQTLHQLREAAEHGSKKGLNVHAGHGLDLFNVAPVAAIEPIEELNIGHAIVADAVFVGLFDAVRAMRRTIADAQGG